MHGNWMVLVEQLFRAERYHDSLRVLVDVTKNEPENWNAWYLLGQCHRMLEDPQQAIKCLEKSKTLKPDDPYIFLALGIAYQLLKQWDDAIESFLVAFELDPLFYLAANSLAKTQSLRGEPEKAAHNYDLALKVFVRGLVMALHNSRSSERCPFPTFRSELWFEHATDAAIFRAIQDGARQFRWLPDETFNDAGVRRTYGGLYWHDTLTDEGKTARLYLQNFHNTMYFKLRAHPEYCLMLRNCGNLLAQVGRHEEATKHIEQATEFST
jgi:tetratricopeptide (TPR) repeat protein